MAKRKALQQPSTPDTPDALGHVVGVPRAGGADNTARVPVCAPRPVLDASSRPQQRPRRREPPYPHAHPLPKALRRRVGLAVAYLLRSPVTWDVARGAMPARALAAAAAHGNEKQTVALVVASGSSEDVCSYAMRRAAVGGHVSLIKRLDSCWRHVLRNRVTMSRVLAAAASMGHVPVIQALLDGLATHGPDWASEVVGDAIIRACAKGRVDALRFLVNAPQAPVALPSNCLSCATRYGHLECVKFLLALPRARGDVPVEAGAGRHDSGVAVSVAGGGAAARAVAGAGTGAGAGRGAGAAPAPRKTTTPGVGAEAEGVHGDRPELFPRAPLLPREPGTGRVILCTGGAVTQVPVSCVRVPHHLVGTARVCTAAAFGIADELGASIRAGHKVHKFYLRIANPGRYSNLGPNHELPSLLAAARGWAGQSLLRHAAFPDVFCIVVDDRNIRVGARNGEALVLAADNGDLPTLQLLLRELRRPESGVYALHAAAERGHEAVVRFLCERPGASQRVPLSAALSAAHEGHVGLLRYFLTELPAERREYIDAGLAISLPEAAGVRGQLAAVQLLAGLPPERGVGLNQAFIAAAGMGHTHVMQWLLDNVPRRVNPAVGGNTPLRLASMERQLGSVKLLCELPARYGVSPAALNRALRTAEAQRNLEMMRYLCSLPSVDTSVLRDFELLSDGTWAARLPGTRREK